MEPAIINEAVSYEYTEIKVNPKFFDIYIDSLKSFGWQYVGIRTNYDGVKLKFKRNREIENRTDLNALQRKFEVQARGIQKLEMQKTLLPSVKAYITGLIGAGIITGAVFSGLGGLIVLMIILGTIGLATWTAAYFLYQSQMLKMTAIVNPEIDSHYDEIIRICKEARKLWA